MLRGCVRVFLLDQGSQAGGGLQGGGQLEGRAVRQGRDGGRPGAAGQAGEVIALCKHGPRCCQPTLPAQHYIACRKSA